MSLQLISVHPDLDVETLLQRSRSEKTLDFDLGAIDPSNPSTMAFFLDFAELRSESYYGFKFRCDLHAGVTSEAASRLSRGGVKTATLLADIEEDKVRPGPPPYLAQLETVRTLFEAGIDVRWEIRWTENMGEPTFGKDLLRTVASARSLPPPNVIADALEDGPRHTMTRRLRESVALWRGEFQRAALTFARGPGFVRIRDRRAAGGGCRFYTLKAQQADILRFCTRIRSRADIAGIAGDVPQARLSAFLERMIESGLIARHGDHHLSLPTRRAMDERWSSEVV